MNRVQIPEKVLAGYYSVFFARYIAVALIAAITFPGLLRAQIASPTYSISDLGVEPVGQRDDKQLDNSIEYTLSDSGTVVDSHGGHTPWESVEIDDKHRHFPSCVSHSPGRPMKPRLARPGDINRKDRHPERYCLPDCKRAGNPHEVAWWAKCAINKNYSAWYVGGGTAWIFPWKTRPRKMQEEGTWGLDYDGLFRPRRVWLRWSSDREQGGLGAYETEREPKFLAHLKAL